MNFVEDLKNVFNVIHAIDVERVELEVYQMKYVTRTWFDQWKEDRDKGSPYPSWNFFEDVFLGYFFNRELEEEKVGDFLTLKQDSLSVHEYELKFI